MRLLRAALLSSNADPMDDVVIPAELQDDAGLLEAAEQTKVAGTEVDEQSAALESLLDAHHLLSSMKADGTYGTQTAQAVAAIYGRHLPATSGVSLESLSEDGYSVALEGKIVDAIRNGFDNWFQQIVVGNKHQNDIFIDFFKSTNGQVQKYSKALEETQQEYNEKRDKFREGDHHASLLELWYFFSTKDGQSRQIIHDLATDAEASKHILNDYPKAVLEALKKLAGIIGRTKIKSEKDLVAFLSEVEKLPTIDKLYGSEYVGEGILFNVTSVVRKIQPPKRVSQIGGKRFAHLAELAGKAQIVEEKSGKHTAKKIFANTTSIGRAIMSGYDREDFVLSTEEIDRIIEAGKRYIENVEGYLNMRRDIENTSREVGTALERMQRAMEYSGEGAHEGVKQVFDYLSNLMKAITTPETDEVVRSIKGAKYCNYLALRMIYNASKYF